MSDPTHSTDAAPAARGETAWLQHCQRIADRNATASRDAKARRQGFEQALAGRRRRAEAEEASRLATDAT